MNLDPNINTKLNLRKASYRIINLKVQEFTMTPNDQKSQQSDQTPMLQKINIYSMS
jgi:hypothetical protein